MVHWLLSEYTDSTTSVGYNGVDFEGVGWSTGCYLSIQILQHQWAIMG